jgi:hypothetical protein
MCTLSEFSRAGALKQRGGLWALRVRVGRKRVEGAQHKNSPKTKEQKSRLCPKEISFFFFLLLLLLLWVAMEVGVVSLPSFLPFLLLFFFFLLTLSFSFSLSKPLLPHTGEREPLLIKNYSTMTRTNKNKPKNSHQDEKDADYFSKLPAEIIFCIFRYLSDEDLASCAMVSTTFYQLAYEPKLWESLYRRAAAASLFQRQPNVRKGDAYKQLSWRERYLFETYGWKVSVNFFILMK